MLSTEYQVVPDRKYPGHRPKGDHVRSYFNVRRNKRPIVTGSQTRTAMKMKEEMLARQDVSAVASIMKLVQSELEVQKYEVIMKGLGADALGWQDENATSPEAQEREEIAKQWMLAKSVTIAGGASEIQLNIIAKRVLGLPDYGGVKA